MHGVITLFYGSRAGKFSLTEEMTGTNKRVSDEIYNQAAKLQEEHYLAASIMAAIEVNAWKRISITPGMMRAAE